MSDWQPTISLKNLQARAQVLVQVRQFFAQHNVMEVETPLLCSHTVTEPNIESFAVTDISKLRYLQTSPEYAMKRLLAAGAPDIFQICKSFRCGEQGVRHNPEFTMVEWYRLGFELKQMMQETVDLIVHILNTNKKRIPIEYVSYNDIFKKLLGVSFFDLAENTIDHLCVEYGLQSQQRLNLTQKIDFIFSHAIVSKFDTNAITCVFHYPAEQAALAKLNVQDSTVAERFEVFCGGLELANGYVELVEPDIQLARFEKDRVIRKENDLVNIEVDQRLLDAQKSGLPECSGVALGLDRLLMLVLGAASIEQVMSFSWENA